MSSLPFTFFGLMQCMPFLTFTTCETRQSDTVLISVPACDSGTLRCSARNLIVSDFAWSQDMLNSWSKPMVIQDVYVSIRGQLSVLPLITSTVMLNSL